MAKIKIKKHSGIAKTMKKRASGSIKISKVGGLHNTGKKRPAHAKRLKSGSVLSKPDLKRIKNKI